MTKQKYNIILSSDDRNLLQSIVAKGTHKAQTIKRAQVLLKLDSSAKKRHTMAELSEVIGISKNTINKIVKGYHSEGITCIYRKKRSTPPVEGKITGDVEAHLIALACHEAPAGYCKWSLRLLAKKMVKLSYIGSISHTSVGTVL